MADIEINENTVKYLSNSKRFLRAFTPKIVTSSTLFAGCGTALVAAIVTLATAGAGVVPIVAAGVAGTGAIASGIATVSLGVDAATIRKARFKEMGIGGDADKPGAIEYIEDQEKTACEWIRHLEDLQKQKEEDKKNNKLKVNGHKYSEREIKKIIASHEKCAYQAVKYLMGEAEVKTSELAEYDGKTIDPTSPEAGVIKALTIQLTKIGQCVQGINALRLTKDPSNPDKYIIDENPYKKLVSKALHKGCLIGQNDTQNASIKKLALHPNEPERAEKLYYELFEKDLLETANAEGRVAEENEEHKPNIVQRLFTSIAEKRAASKDIKAKNAEIDRLNATVVTLNANNAALEQQRNDERLAKETAETQAEAERLAKETAQTEAEAERLAKEAAQKKNNKLMKDKDNLIEQAKRNSQTAKTERQAREESEALDAEIIAGLEEELAAAERATATLRASNATVEAQAAAERAAKEAAQKKNNKLTRAKNSLIEEARRNSQTAEAERQAREESEALDADIIAGLEEELAAAERATATLRASNATAEAQAAAERAAKETAQTEAAAEREARINAERKAAAEQRSREEAEQKAQDLQGEIDNLTREYNKLDRASKKKEATISEIKTKLNYVISSAESIVISELDKLDKEGKLDSPTSGLVKNAKKYIESAKNALNSNDNTAAKNAVGRVISALNNINIVKDHIYGK